LFPYVFSLFAKVLYDSNEGTLFFLKIIFIPFFIEFFP